MAVLWVVVVVSALIGHIAGWAYMMEGDCPDNHQPGNTWFEGCSRCDCHAGAYACYGCGVASTPAKSHCYMENPYPNENYPRCCEVEEVCPGDKNFDHHKIAASLGMGIGR